MDVKSNLHLSYLQQIRCLCEAEVVEILNGDGWYYECCTTCARAVQKREGQVFCPGCQDTKEKTSHRYRVVARVKDDSETTTFTLFNKEAEQLIGVPLEKILTELDQEGNMEDIPTPIKNMVGKFCAFQIKVTQYNITTGCEEYTVTRVSECSKTPATTSTAEEETHKDKRMKTA
ncbi:hypothetical protein DCAR_0205985 [Daucus carota subsp. sativus]|uniref:Uncharacterized protein n=1 Tax=Daucus carota subsp. sativus TaxID=79200 RepID=A0A161X0G2_DAUCS|nr:hypothetical protein DCAR_0205985 [Daucus carota subsp. sativus]